MHSPMSVAMLQCSTVGVKRTCMVFGATVPDQYIHEGAPAHSSVPSPYPAYCRPPQLRLAQDTRRPEQSKPAHSTSFQFHPSRTCTVPATSSTSTCSSVTTFSCSKVYGCSGSTMSRMCCMWVKGGAQHV